MLARPSFFADIVHPSARPNIALRDRFGRPIRLPGLALLDEPRVLGEAAGIEKERLAEPIAQARGRRAGSPATPAARHPSCW